MDDQHDDTWPTETEEPVDAGEQRRRAWARALDGPPINPRSELIYHDGKPLRSRHA